MLITSRGTGRWVVPKGNPMKGLAPHRAAAHEAYEEAGITGTAFPASIGSFSYSKRLKGGGQRTALVDVYPLAFVTQAAKWPEQSERQTRWFGRAEAADAVAEPELAAIIAGFRIPDPAEGDSGRGWLSRRPGLLRWLEGWRLR